MEFPDVKKTDGSFPSFITVLFVFSALCSGLFYEWSACLISVLLLAALMRRILQNGAIMLPCPVALLATASVPVMFLLSEFWAVDRGMTVYGFFKTLPLPLFLLCIHQEKGCVRERLLSWLPDIGTGMMLISAAFSRIPSLTSFFSVNHRLAGFFQYPNAFAAFLLCCMAILLFRENAGKYDVVKLLLLFLGILLSGSRTALFLALCLGAVCLFRVKKKKIHFLMTGSMVLLLAAGIALACLSGNFASFGRILTASVQSSTLLGRILYAQDALPVILKHPLGLGYLGYRFLQGSFQTGVYSVTYIHDELLQLMLDAGWIPAILWVYLIGRSFFSCRITDQRRALMLVLCIHSLFDFDFQFTFLGFVLILAVDTDPGTVHTISKKALWSAVAAGTGLVCIYFGMAAGFYSLNRPEYALRLYPFHTLALMDELVEEGDTDRMEECADRILSLNESVSLAHSAKARAAFSHGAVKRMMEHKELALSLAPYSLDEYLDYFDMLEYCADLYWRSGDIRSAFYCAERMQTIPEMMAAVKEKTSGLGRKIQDKPMLDLPEEYWKRLERTTARFGLQK